MLSWAVATAYHAIREAALGGTLALRCSIRLVALDHDRIVESNTGASTALV